MKTTQKKQVEDRMKSFDERGQFQPPEDDKKERARVRKAVKKGEKKLTTKQ